jgi:hypothetical protein
VRRWLLVSTVVSAVGALALDAGDGIASGGDHDGAVERQPDSSDKPSLLERNDHGQRKSRWSTERRVCDGWLEHCDDRRWSGVRGYVARAGPDLGRPDLDDGLERPLRLPLHRHPQSDSKWIHIRHGAVRRGPR